jgi:thiol:disulfide interchange protein DsbA
MAKKKKQKLPEKKSNTTLLYATVAVLAIVVIVVVLLNFPSTPKVNRYGLDINQTENSVTVNVTIPTPQAYLTISEIDYPANSQTYNFTNSSTTTLLISFPKTGIYQANLYDHMGNVQISDFITVEVPTPSGQAGNSTPQEKPVEKFPAAGGYKQLSFPATYEPGKVKIIEFLKFNCPFCYMLHTNLPQILEKYGDNVTITYVPIVWPGESTKTIDAYIIAEQMGKGKEMQDALFNEAAAEGLTNGNENLIMMNSVPTLERVAASIGLGSDFNAKLEGNLASNATNANLQLMNKYGVQSTPTIIINGNLLVNPPTAANLDTVLSSLLS